MYHVGEGAYIRVKEGHMLGIHYDSTSGSGVIPYEDSRYAFTNGLEESDLSSLYNASTTDAQLPVGTEVDMIADAGYKRMPAIKAFIGQYYILIIRCKINHKLIFIIFLCFLFEHMKCRFTYQGQLIGNLICKKKKF